ncbi:helix-turn-helix transcriptional regulator [Streptomyces sp. BK205]|uniref:helix-turn-helix transcriptional regulator n=1 Tax=Streptomyces sp. BK205 TaxID=2512164 RepID=UPI0010E3F261|nr:helix-turn-helix transcriptional regulator [Streptomyces sp. BK205]TCR22951.1 DNA-binding XRE family transcriptional regulator [Streptomyces sp. BK205]
MPARRFDPNRVLLARREGGLKQTDVASYVGVSGARVSSWETARSVPDPEKLRRLAEALRHDLDDLFPRDGRPDLADLRADAGYTQAATRELTGTSTAGPVAAAENAQRRLAEEYEPILAEAYGVSVEALRRAQDRSFGNDVPEPGEAALGAAGPEAQLQRGQGGLPETLAEKITYLLDRLPNPLSDAQLAALGNDRTGREVLNEDLVRGLRTGEVSGAQDDVLNALAEALDTTPLIWSQDADVQRIIGGTMLLRGQLSAIAARGGQEEGLPADLLDFILHEVDKVRSEARDGHGRPAQP